MSNGNNKVFPIQVRDRNGLLFDGDVRGVTSYNSKGMFDLLPVHSNFITILRKKLVLHKIDGSKQEINIDSAIMRVLLNNVEVFVGVR